MQSRVSVRGQTVIPKAIREVLNITPKTVLDWHIQDGAIVVHPIPADPVKASLGILKGKGVTFEDFMRDRQEERRKEKALEKRWEKERR